MQQHYSVVTALALLILPGLYVPACSYAYSDTSGNLQGLGGNTAPAVRSAGTFASQSSSGNVGQMTAPAHGGAASTSGSTVNGSTAGSVASSGGASTIAVIQNGGTLGSGGARTVASSSSGGANAAGGASASGGQASTAGASSYGGRTASVGGTTSVASATNAAGGTVSGTTSSNVGGNATGGTTGTEGVYACNLVFGNSTTQQWFDGGFLSYPQIESTRWELIAVAHHYIDSWANANDVGWTSAFDVGHQCTNRSTTPDRVIFIVTYAPPYPPQATYQTYITSIVNNIRTRYPTVKRIELTTLVRAPGNSATACSTKANNEQSMPATEDQAITAVAADPAFAGLVFALPPFYVTSCSDFNADAPQYTTAGAANIAKVYGAYYAAHP